MVIAAIGLALSFAPFQPAQAAVGSHRVTNLTDKAFTLSWTSAAPEQGTIDWGTTVGLGQTSTDDRGAVAEHTHHVTLAGLLPNTTYFYDVVSGSARDDKGGAHYSVTTGPTLLGPRSDIAFGRVLQSNELAGAPGCLVYVKVQDADGQGSEGSSQLFSVLSEGTGLDVFWNANLGTLREQDGGSFFAYDSTGDDATAVEVDCGDQGSASLNVPTNADSPAPDLTLAVATVGGPTPTPTPGTTSAPAPGGGGGAIASTPTPLRTVDMNVVITGWPNTVTAGSEVSFDVTVTNNGERSATDIVLLNTLPSSTDFTIGSPGCVESRSGIVRCEVDFLNPGDNAKYSISFLVPASIAPGTTLTDSATVTSTQPDANPSDNAIEVSATVTASASVSLSRDVGAHEIIEFGGGSVAAVLLRIDPPTGGRFEVTIKPSPTAGTAPVGYSFEGFPEIAIEAFLNPTFGEPLLLAFSFASDTAILLPTHVFRNGVVVSPCGIVGLLSPDPCVSEQTGNSFIVLTSASSTWNFGVVVQTVPALTPAPTPTPAAASTPVPSIAANSTPTPAPNASNPSPIPAPTLTSASRPTLGSAPTMELAPTPQPTATAPTAPPTLSTSTASADDGGNSIIPWLIGGIFLAVVAAGAGLLPLRKRR